MLVHQSLDCFVVVVICGCADNGFVRHWVLCVFFRKYVYMCGVDVLDKGCGGINVQVYVGFRVFWFGAKDSQEVYVYVWG